MLKFVDLLSGHPIGCKLVGQKPTKFESSINFGPTPQTMIISNAILVKDAFKERWSSQLPFILGKRNTAISRSL